MDYPRTWNLHDNGAMVNVTPIILMAPTWHPCDGYPWDSFLSNSRTFLCRSERFFITAVFLI